MAVHVEELVRVEAVLDQLLARAPLVMPAGSDPSGWTAAIEGARMALNQIDDFIFLNFDPSTYDSPEFHALVLPALEVLEQSVDAVEGSGWSPLDDGSKITLAEVEVPQFKEYLVAQHGGTQPLAPLTDTIHAIGRISDGRIFVDETAFIDDRPISPLKKPVPAES